MKKIGLLVMPLVAVLFLTDCSQLTPTPVVDIAHNFHFIGANCTINGKNEYSHNIFEKDKDVQYTIVPGNEFKLPDDISSEDVSYDKNTGVITISEIKHDITLNVTAIPNPTKNTYTVSYSANGGKVTSVNPDVVDANAPITPPTLADRPEYDESKVKWLDKSGNEFNFEAGTNDNIVLFANWGDKIPVTVHFVETSTKKVDKKIGYGERAVYYTPTQQGFAFTGWYDKNPETEATAKEFDFNTPITTDTPIYAGWKASAGTTCNVKFNITDCAITYKGAPVGEGGANIEVPQGVNPYYVKFSVKASDSVYKKPSDVTLDKTTDYTFDSDSGDLFINVQSNLNVTGTCNIYKSLEECSWAQIKVISEAKEAPNAFHIGDEKTVKMNNKEHKVRIIGFNHDYSELLDDGSDPDPSKVLGITFEFVNLITNSNGNAITKQWENKEGVDSKNYDYRESTLNNFLNDTGDNDSIINMLPDDLKTVIKQVDKKVNVNETATVGSEYYNVISFDGDDYPYPYLFTLAYDETATHEDDATNNEGFKYQYYVEHPNETDRIKRKAGVETENGEYYWLRSPLTYTPFCVWSVADCGYISYANVDDHEYGVAPAFCL